MAVKCELQQQSAQVAAMTQAVDAAEAGVAATNREQRALATELETRKQTVTAGERRLKQRWEELTVWEVYISEELKETERWGTMDEDHYWTSEDPAAPRIGAAIKRGDSAESLPAGSPARKTPARPRARPVSARAMSSPGLAPCITPAARSSPSRSLAPSSGSAAFASPRSAFSTRSVCMVH